MMTLLGDFLESFYGRTQTFRSVQAQVRCERTPTLRGASSRRRAIGREKATIANSKPTIADLRLWAVLPDRVRVDSTRTKDGQTQATIEIANGQQHLKQCSDGSVEIDSAHQRGGRNGDALPTEFRRHFDRRLIRQFFASLVLEQLGECKIAGRDCVRVKAQPVPLDQIWPHWLPAEADEFEFAADLVFPSLLSIKGLLSGKVIESLEVVGVTFDEPIDDSVFTCKPREGQSVRKAVPVTQPISLEAAVAKVPYTVLLPRNGIGEGTPHVHFEPLQPDGSGENLTIFYHESGPNTLWITLRRKPDPELENSLEWDEVEASGRRFQISDPDSEGGMIVLRFCQDGTWIDVFSDHTRKEVLRIAESFEPVEL